MVTFEDARQCWRLSSGLCFAAAATATAAAAAAARTREEVWECEQHTWGDAEVGDHAEEDRDRAAVTDCVQTIDGEEGEG